MQINSNPEAVKYLYESSTEKVRTLSLCSPLIVDFEITSKCSYRCTFCPSSDGKVYRKECSYLEKVKILKRLAEAKVYSVFLTGGDPFLCPDLLKIYESCIKFDISPMVSTNGIEANSQIIDELHNLGLRVIQVSLQGTEKIHDTIVREKGAYKKVVRNMLYMLKKGIEVRVAIVGLRDNFDTIASFVDEMSKIGVMTIRIIRLIPYSWNKLSYIPLKKQLKNLQNIFEIALKRNVSLLVGSCPGYKEVADYTLQFVHPWNYFCPAGKSRFGIASDGTVFPCIIFKESKMIVGNLLYDTVKKAWEHPTMKLFRSLTPNEYTGKCKECRRKWLCYSCRGVAWTFSNDLYGDDFSCYEVSKDLKKIKRNLQNLPSYVHNS